MEIKEFVSATGVQVAFGLNALYGRNKTCHTCPWDSSNTHDFLKSVVIPSGFIPNYLEFGNELQPYIAASVYGKDILSLKTLLDDLQWPAGSPPKLVANDENPDPGYWGTLLPIVKGALLASTWHLYIGYGLDPLLAGDAWDVTFMDKIMTTANPMVHAAEQAGFQGELWVGESAMAWHSGREGVTDTFLSSPWWVSVLGSLAPTHSRFCRQTLMGGNYELVNKTTRAPNPDFYVAKLWKSTMGEKVLQASVEGNSDPLLKAYSHCLPSTSPSPGVGLTLINFSHNTTTRVDFTESFPKISSWEYTVLSSPDNSTLLSNGLPLIYTPNSGKLPSFNPNRTPGDGSIELPPHTITFLSVFGAVGVCA